VFYKVSYRLGFHPWEDLAAHPPFADQLLSLVAREEYASSRRTDGLWTSAAEARSGSNWRSVAGRSPGWTTSARPSSGGERIRDAGVEMALVLGDVTRLHESDIGSGLPAGPGHQHVPRLDSRRTRCYGPCGECGRIRRCDRCCSTALRRAGAGRCPVVHPR
jgi:hypothetical protein